MPRVFALFIAVLSCATVTYGSVPIVVGTGAGKMAVMKLCSDASHQLNNGDVEGAKQSGQGASDRSEVVANPLHSRGDFFAAG